MIDDAVLPTATAMGMGWRWAMAMGRWNCNGDERRGDDGRKSTRLFSLFAVINVNDT